MGKRILPLPKYHANLCPLIALQWPSMCCRILIRKLQFLNRLINPKSTTIGSRVFDAIRDQEPGPLIVQQCKLLEQVYKANVTPTFIKGDTTISSVKKALLKLDRDYIWSLTSKHNSLRSLTRSISLPKLWDLSRDYGIQGTRSVAIIFKILTSPIFDEYCCPHCSTIIPRDSILAEHLLTTHLSYPLDKIFSLLEAGDEDLFIV